MYTAKTVVAEIHDLTEKMIEIGLCVDPNYPSETVPRSTGGVIDEISISGVDEASVALKNRPYAETYRDLRKRRVFNMCLIDGALIQFWYRFQDDQLVKHILSFFPSPDLVEYQNNSELYDSDVLFTEAIRKDVVTCPIRFDFDQAAAQDYIHPASHFTIGQYKNCRIPVRSGLTPYRFLNFVLRAFYNTVYQKYCSDWSGSVSDFADTITEHERSDLHLSFL